MPYSKESKVPEVIEYKSKLKNYLTTTRFNNSTWAEDQNYIKISQKLGCIYPTPEANCQNIPLEINMFVLEMNNETNRIMGIGLVKNKPIYNKYNVYSNPKYNVFAYIGKYRIDRNEMTDEEERIMIVFDTLCFKGCRHMKRLTGMKSFPIDILYKCSALLDLVEFIATMFKTRFIKNSVKEPEKNYSEEKI